MDKTKRTAANAISQIMALILQSLFLLIITRVLIKYIGSDYNGISSTVTQILIFIALLEGGFTLASLVKLYEPYKNQDYEIYNKYLSLTDKKFKKIGIAYLLVGIVISLLYTPFVKTSASALVTATIMILSVVSSAFSIYYVSKYRLLYQVSQSEYITYNIQNVVYFFMYIAEFLIIVFTKNIILYHLCSTFFRILTGIAIAVYAKKKFPNVSFNSNYSDVTITGTKDLFMGKVCGIIFNSVPILFISSFVGTAYTSVYVVYNYVISFITNAVNAFLIAPRNALGLLLNTNTNRMRIEKIFNEYEFITSFVMSLLLATTMSLIIPFMKLYTKGVTDVEYIDITLAILLVINTLFYLVHIPSGICMEVTGRFKAIKKIQTIAAFMIIALSIIGAITYKLYGILLGKLITSMFLTVAEVYYTRKHILKCSLYQFIKINCPSIAIAMIISSITTVYIINFNISIIAFIVLGVIVVLVNAIFITLINLIFNREYLVALKHRLLLLLAK